MTTENTLQANQLMPTDEHARLILQKRADNIAKDNILKDDSKDKVEYVKFTIGSEQLYGIDYKYIVSVKNDAIINNSPVQQNHIVGLYNYRGLIISIVDLAEYVNSNIVNKTLSNTNRNILIVKDEAMYVGLLVDNVIGADFYDAGQLQLDCMQGTKNESQLLLGIHHGNTGIIDIKYILKSV
jgi:chemotaxis signal transduction protein